MNRPRILVALWTIVLGCSATPPSSSPAPAHTPTAEVTGGPDAAPPSPPPPVPPPPGPVDTPEARAAHRSVQERFLGGSLLETELVHDVPIEDPSGTALDRWHAALDEISSGAKVRVAIYGSSSVAADRYPAYLRGYLQHRFGDGGIGYVSLVPLWPWHRHNEVEVSASSRWAVEHAQREEGKLDGHYGLMGASAHTSSRRTWTKLTANQGAHSLLENTETIDIFYLAQPGGGSFDVTLAGRRTSTVHTTADAPSLGRTSIVPTSGIVQMRVITRGDGEVRLFGAALERKGPGIVVDSLGVGGTRAANALLWTPEIWQSALRDRDPDLYVLAYGANEAVDEDEPMSTYEANLAQVLDLFHATLPQASCVLIGPVDFRRQTAEAWALRPRVRAIMDAQRKAATEHGCGYFDSFALMGGEDSMQAWVGATPPLAKPDHLHLTTLGYLQFGRVFTDALMARYDSRQPPT